MGSMGAIGRRFSGHQAPVIRGNRAQHSINSVLGIARASRALTLSLVPRDWCAAKPLRRQCRSWVIRVVSPGTEASSLPKPDFAESHEPLAC